MYWRSILVATTIAGLFVCLRLALPARDARPDPDSDGGLEQQTSDLVARISHDVVHGMVDQPAEEERAKPVAPLGM